MKFSIIGHGFVGKAVEFGFSNNANELVIIDPNYNTSVEDLGFDDNIYAHFVCVPTPVGKGGEINANIVKSVMEHLIENTSGLIVLKSTVTPDIVNEFANKTDRFVYNPEFLTERNYKDDFINPIMHIFGGSEYYCNVLEYIYKNYSNCSECPVYKMSALNASFVKYGINSFLATKVSFFNEFYKLVEKMGGDYNTIVEAIGTDDRVSKSHTKVPGPDGKFGFSGACFPKDMLAIYMLSNNLNSELSIIKQAIRVNQDIQSNQTLDERAKAQNITFDFSI